MTAPPRVSVLITTYNGARLIGQTVDSILGQNFSDFELVVVDDQSTDATGDVLAAYRDQRLRVIRAPRNLGVVGSRNLGFAQTRGALVAAIEHDDLSRPTRLARQVAYLDAHPAVVLVGTDDQLYENGAMRLANPAFATDPMFMRWLLLLRNPIAYSSVMFRADAVRRLGVFMREERVYADDFDLYHRLLSVGEVGRVDERLTVYRLHGENTFRKREEQMIGNAARVLRETYESLIGADAEEAALLVTRYLFAQRVTDDADELQRLTGHLQRLQLAFSQLHGLPEGERRRIADHVGRLLRAIVQRHLRTGRFRPAWRLWSHPALARAPDLVSAQSGKSALIGVVPARDALRSVRDSVASGRAGGALVAARPVRFAGLTFDPAPAGQARLEQDRPPTLFVVVDTEAEFDWSQPFSQNLIQVTSIAAQGQAQDIFDGYGLRPVYVVDYPVATQAEAYGPLRAIMERGGCEIGAHHHPWTTPPLDEVASNRNSYPGNLPADLEARKLGRLVQAIRENFGIDPAFYKAGRYGLGAATPGLIARLGMRVDFSVLPGVDLRPRGGPDFRQFVAVPYQVAETGVLTLPMSRARLGLLAAVGGTLESVARHKAMRAARLGAVLSRARLVEGITLTPEGVTAPEQIRLLEAMLRRGHRAFVLHYHSPSLSPGHTPYVRTAADAREFRHRIEAVLDHFTRNIGGLPGNPRDLLPPGMRGLPGPDSALASAA